MLYLYDWQGLIGRAHFAIDGVKLPSNASKLKSGTRAEFAQQATKLEREVQKMLARHRDNDACDAKPDQAEREQSRMAELKQQAAELRRWLKTHSTERTGSKGTTCHSARSMLTRPGPHSNKARPSICLKATPIK